LASSGKSQKNENLDSSQTYQKNWKKLKSFPKKSPSQLFKNQKKKSNSD
jgi:hypothetical protein